MMHNKKMLDLRQHALNKKNPIATLLGRVSDSWLENAALLCNSISDNLENSINVRHSENIYGTTVSDLKISNYYTQRNVINLEDFDFSELPMTQISYVRFAILKKDAILPDHIDSPYSYRFICIISGTHLYSSENLKINMGPGEIWYVNGSFKHSITNTSDNERVALLGTFEINHSNTKLINKEI